MYDKIVNDIRKNTKREISRKQKERKRQWRNNVRWYNPATWFSPKLSKCEKMEIKFAQYEMALEANPDIKIVDKDELQAQKEYLREKLLTERYTKGSDAYKSEIKLLHANNPGASIDKLYQDVLEEHERAVPESEDITEFDKKKHEVQKELCAKITEYKKSHPVKYFITGGAEREEFLTDMLKDADNDPIKREIIKSKLDGLRTYAGERDTYINNKGRKEIQSFIEKRKEFLNGEFEKECKEKCRELNVEKLSAKDELHLKKVFVGNKLKENPGNILEKVSLESFMGRSLGTDRAMPITDSQKKKVRMLEDEKLAGLTALALVPPVVGGFLGAMAPAGYLFGVLGALGGAFISVQAGRCFRLNSKIGKMSLQNKVVRAIGPGKNVTEELNRLEKKLSANKQEQKEFVKAKQMEKKSGPKVLSPIGVASQKKATDKQNLNL